jgi:hypothetical protein
MQALENEPVYKFASVKVNAYKGVVQLSGFVDTPEQKQRAAEVAKSAERTHDVVNDIALKPQDTLSSASTGAARGERTGPDTTSTQAASSRSTTP